MWVWHDQRVSTSMPGMPRTRTAALPPPAPIRRLLSLAIGGFAALLTVGLTNATQLGRWPFAAVVFGVQVLFVLAWTVAMRPAGHLVVATVGLTAAAAADVVAVTSEEASLIPIGYVTAGAFGLAVLGQLARRGNRVKVTESMGATLAVVAGVIAYSCLIVFSRKVGGTQALLVGLLATGVAVMLARLLDAVAPVPRMAPQVPRGAIGVIVGAMAGTAAAAVAGAPIVLITPATGAVIGLGTAICAVATDLAVGYAEAGREIAGDEPTMWLARHMQGPLGAFALAAPVTYILGDLLRLR